MRYLKKVNSTRVILTIVIVAICAVIFQGMQTNAQAPADNDKKAGNYDPVSNAIKKLTAQLEQANVQIAELEARLQATESRAMVLQSHYGDLNRQIALLNGEIREATDDRKSDFAIGKVARFAGGKPGAKDMVVSINKFSITWKQIDAILDKLDEITQTLSQQKF